MNLSSRKGKIGIALAVCGALAAAAIIAGLSLRGEGPPLDGTMANFTLAEAPAEAPPGAFFDRRGAGYSMDDFEGKVILVNFWATWCAPCIREMPSLLGLQRALEGEDFVLLALSEDRGGWPEIEPFLDRHGLKDLAVYHDAASATLRQFAVQGLPTTVLIDRRGREVGRLRGIAEWNSEQAVALVRHYLGP